VKGSGTGSGNVVTGLGKEGKKTVERSQTANLLKIGSPAGGVSRRPGVSEKWELERRLQCSVMGERKIRRCSWGQSLWVWGVKAIMAR